MIDDWKENHRGFQAHKKKKPPQQQQRVTITQKDWDKIDAILGNDQIRTVQPAVVLPRWVCRASQLGKPDGRDLAPAPLWRGLLFVAPLSGGRPGRVWGGLARQRWGVVARWIRGSA